MATVACELLRREGEAPFPCVVRTPDGRTLRLHGDAAPRHARWFGLCDGMAIWSEPADNPGPPTGIVVEIAMTEQVDEVGVPLGPDRGGEGLFDTPDEASLTGERTGVSSQEAGAEQQRLAVLAWISATLAEPADLPETGPPSATLRTRIADEPPDLLPSLGFVPAPRDARVPRPPPVAPNLFADDTVTQVDLLRPAGEPSGNTSPGLGGRSATGATTTGHTTTGGLTRMLRPERLLRVAPWIAATLLVASALAYWAWA